MLFGEGQHGFHQHDAHLWRRGCLELTQTDVHSRVLTSGLIAHDVGTQFNLLTLPLIGHLPPYLHGLVVAVVHIATQHKV